VAGIAQVVRGTARALGTTLRNAFRRPATVRYPAERRPIPKRWRAGTFALTLDPKTGEENCIGCRLCEYICPSQIISVSLRKGEERVSGGGATYCQQFTLEFQACMQCELCIQVCPTDAIVMTRFLAAPSATRAGLFLDRETLFSNGRRLLSAPDDASEALPSRLREWTDAARGLAEPREPAP